MKCQKGSGRSTLKQLLFGFYKQMTQGTHSPDSADTHDSEWETFCEKKLTQIGVSNLRVQVIFNGRLRTTAGTANFQTNTISLHSGLKKISREQTEVTILHELAHLLAHHRSGCLRNWRHIPAHGAEWKQACADLGILGEKRCHSLDLGQRKKMQRHFFYKCPHCGETITRVRQFRKPCACFPCCRKFNHGRYDNRFRLSLVT